MAGKILIILFSAIGIVFFIGGTVGILRFPDLYSRLHPSTKCDTLGACSIIIALCIYSGLSADTLKLALIIFFLLLSSATCGHAIGRSALKHDIVPWHKPDVKPLPIEGEKS
ncbi:MAG: monovalent cation/H(+) antiporter subunit G [Actinobacteria bacterium]|nr:monovalent cation/H(+) antiporter subunit G [Actinomycetota bacterium]